MGLKRLFETNDIEVAIRSLVALGVSHHISRGSRVWVHCSVADLPTDMRERAAEIAIDENRRNTVLGRENNDGTFSASA
jgi:hypothetical protein